MSFHTLTQPDLTVTVDMRVYLQGAEAELPKEWVLHVILEGTRARVTIENDGKFMPLKEALERLCELKLLSCSRRDRRLELAD